MVEKRHVVICGAGAAGLTAAIFASEAGADVTILERTDKAGKKILMSGGTRCNVLPVVMNTSDFFTGSSVNRMKKIFKSWPLNSCKDWFETEIGLRLACEESSNKWFPVSNSAKEVRNLLLDKAQENGVSIRYQSAVNSLNKEGDKWLVSTENKTQMLCDTVVLSTGGYSIPTVGTDGMGHRLLKKMGHTTEPVYAALTPLRCDYAAHQALSGLSLDVQLDVYLNGKKEISSKRSGFLFTHRGYSGPAILDVSHYAVQAFENDAPKPEFRVNWDGSSREEWEERLSAGKATVLNTVRDFLPKRLAECIIQECQLAERKVAELKKAERKKVLMHLTEYTLPVSGHEGYKKAEVTGGGIPLDEVNTATLQSNLYTNLFLCGEILDVFGRIGGFNFYWAWVTGRLAGIHAGKT